MVRLRWVSRTPEMWDRREHEASNSRCLWLRPTNPLRDKGATPQEPLPHTLEDKHDHDLVDDYLNHEGDSNAMEQLQSQGEILSQKKVNEAKKARALAQLASCPWQAWGKLRTCQSLRCGI